MTAPQIADLLQYIYHERIGIMCGGARPTQAQIKIAMDESKRASDMAQDWELVNTFPKESK